MTDKEASIITPQLREWIGRRSSRVFLPTIGDSDIRRYADATGDKNPLWLDEGFARAVGYERRLLPPTLVAWTPFSVREGTEGYGFTSVNLRRQLPLPEEYTNVRNAGSETEWLRPVYLGEQLATQSSIVDIVARRGRRGSGIYITEEEQVFDSSGEPVVRRRHTIVLFPEERSSGR